MQSSARGKVGKNACRMVMTSPATAAAVGAFVGVMYAVTPVTFWAALLAALAILVSARALPIQERRVLLTICAAAVGIRFVVIGVMLVLGTPHHNDLATGALAGDEAYNLSRALRTRDVLTLQPASKYDHVVAYDEYGYSSYVSLLTAVQIAAGPSPYGMRALNAVVFLVGALLLFHIVHRAYGTLTAFVGLAAILAIPSLAAWSISLLKEPIYFAGSALLLWCAVMTFHADGWKKRFGVGLLAMLALWLLDDLRRGSLVLSASGIALGLTIRVVLLRRWSGVAAVIAVVGLTTVVVSSERTSRRLISGLESAAKLHSGHVFTVGHSYKLLDDGFYVNPQATAASTLTLSPPQAARFVLRGVSSFILEPLPWRMASRRELMFLPELMLWYGIVVLVPFGVWAGWRDSPLVTSLLLCFPLPTALALALTTGNVGTLLRLRGLVLPFLLWLSVLGLLFLIARFSRRQPA
jgi:hypothetical protein